MSRKYRVEQYFTTGWSIVDKDAIKLTKDQAINKIQSLKKDLFNIRFKKINNQIQNSAQYKEIKRNIARLNTTLRNTK